MYDLFRAIMKSTLPSSPPPETHTISNSPVSCCWCCRLIDVFFLLLQRSASTWPFSVHHEASWPTQPHADFFHKATHDIHLLLLLPPQPPFPPQGKSQSALYASALPETDPDTAWTNLCFDNSTALLHSSVLITKSEADQTNNKYA